MAKKKFRDLKSEWDDERNTEDRKRYDKKRQKIRNARKTKTKSKYSYIDSE